MINPVRAVDQKIFNEQQNLRLKPPETPSIHENGVDVNADPTKYVSRKDEVSFNYDIDSYVRILKNMVVPPEDRFDASILLELELDGKITAQEVKELIYQVNRKENIKENSQPADDDSKGREA